MRSDAKWRRVDEARGHGARPAPLGAALGTRHGQASPARRFPGACRCVRKHPSALPPPSRPFRPTIAIKHACRNIDLGTTATFYDHSAGIQTAVGILHWIDGLPDPNLVFWQPISWSLTFYSALRSLGRHGLSLSQDISDRPSSFPWLLSTSSADNCRHPTHIPHTTAAPWLPTLSPGTIGFRIPTWFSGSQSACHRLSIRHCARLGGMDSLSHKIFWIARVPSPGFSPPHLRQLT